MKKWPFIASLCIGIIIGFGIAEIYNSSNKNNSITNRHSAAANIKADNGKWIWADSLDAVKAAPKSHQVVFENDKIRILEVILNPYQIEPMHTHRFPSVMFGASSGDTSSFDIIYDRYGYDTLKHKYYIKQSIRQHSSGSKPGDPNTGDYMRPEGPHRIRNLSNIKIDVFRVEFKDEKKSN